MIDLSNYDTGSYDPGPSWRRVLWYVASVVFFESPWPWPRGWKRGLLRLFGAAIGERAVIKPSVKIKFPWNLSVGNFCWIGEHAWIDNLAPVTLGDHAVVSQDVYLVTGNHDMNSPGFDLMLAPIELKQGAWAAARSVVCPGVVLGECAVLTAGSVASKSLDAWGVYSGNPATFVRTRTLRDQPPGGASPPAGHGDGRSPGND